MIDTLSITISRPWPAMSTPMLNADRIAISTPKSRNAKKIAPIVKNVRNFRRSRLRQTMGRNFMRPPPLRHEHALVEMQRALGARRRVRIVRHHDDGLALVAIERLQQIEDLVARLAIEVARRLVAEQQRRVGDDRARDADALLLAARELARIVVHPLAEADDRQRDLARACAARPSTASSAAAAARRSAPPSAPAAGCTTGRRSRCGARARPRARAPDSLSMRSPPTVIDPSRRRVEPADQVEQRRLARAGRAHQREEISLGDIEVDALQDVDALTAPLKHLVQIANRDQRIRHHCTLTLSPSFSVCGPSDDHAFARADAGEHFRLIARSSVPTLTARRSTRSSCITKTIDRPSAVRTADCRHEQPRPAPPPRPMPAAR